MESCREKFIRIRAVAAPLQIANVDTDIEAGDHHIFGSGWTISTELYALPARSNGSSRGFSLDS